jgi:predicted DNA-binding transcriptional regulator YafY
MVRAVELAKRFEVTVRTIERDLLALQEAGVPIWAQPGPGGGYSLNADTTLPPLNLTPAEAAAIATALAATRSMPFVGAARSALHKLSAAMSSGGRDGAIKLMSRIRISPALQQAAEENVAAIIQRALQDSLAVEIDYRDRNGAETTRTVEPSGLVGVRAWYLVGWCRLRQDGRPFRLDRILAARLTSERISPRPIEDMLANMPLEVEAPLLNPA